MLLDNSFTYGVGIMSGTSLDGIDVAVVKISEENDSVHIELEHFDTVPYSNEVKQVILDLCDPITASIQLISSMNMLLGKLYAEAALKAIDDSGLRLADISFISSHGQTIFHQPDPIDAAGELVASTLQIGDISTIAELTGITSVGDFRTRDMAVGGQGAPLVPYADYLLFRSQAIGRVLVNIGGIANLTILPKNSAPSQVKAYDTGPGNMIIDYFARRMTNGEWFYDKNGELAANGSVNHTWLDILLQEPYYKIPPPKSTGRELFGEEYAIKLWNDADKLSINLADRIATITKLTAVTLTNDIKRHIEPDGIREVFISGGGSYNPILMKEIRNGLPDHVQLRKMDEIGMPADAKEAMIFALLGYQCLKQRTNNFPPATGAKREVVMGKVAWGTLRG
ncbi:anhydro-N-acetylmuramic acid kinase [Ornithinibacillus sp. BX22]|uniref:Anhydro-N-acetylmuramic acid kinase n=2 Tax=Ornithinibacillus TaxID=484508 RepID=A0A923L760_9BACI|nr:MULTISPECIES: anhydro-N-acetylmuramic acid kinase [Ornithinibacillus]MBC5637646.1 anhydro-N-acetylmuramic acid kinase [Ornithinibacillus hominis]MBS3681678.1 anhydro-N-acetylmuramic acid kinase [Ornithinibacillus massiliensis]